MITKGKEKILSLFEKKNVVITTHFKPDGDALGSSLALYHWLHDKGIHVSVIVPSDYPDMIQWLPGNEIVIQYPQNIELSKKLISEADLIFCLDYSSIGRTESMAEVILEAKAEKWMIDHHLHPEDFADVQYWDNNAAATCQLLYSFMTEIYDDAKSITPEIATCLYAGIVTDTSSFRFRSVTADLHRIAAHLIEIGVKNWEVHENLFNNNSENKLKFLGYCLSHCLHVVPEYNTAYFLIPAHILEKFDSQTGDTEGLANYALSIKGIKLAALIIDRTHLIKLSLRSIGDVPCNEICRKYFNGGGHLNASGGRMETTLEETEKVFLNLLPEYKNVLTEK